MRILLFFLVLCTGAVAAEPKEIVSEILELADVRIGGDRPWDISVHDEAFYERVLKDQSLGLGESYMLGYWDCEALDECMFHIMRADLEHKLKPTWGML